LLPTMFGCAQQGAVTPLSVSITTPDDLVIAVPPGASGGTSNSGEISSTATASGGDGSYTYAWTLSEIADPENKFAVASQGTTNAATYNTGTVSTTQSNPLPPTPPPPPPQTATFRVSCTVTDGNGDTATANANFNVDAV
jgi:hypothetical protein